jgi:tripartite-type tricarboxylate transporter receptor subunit TctC
MTNIARLLVLGLCLAAAAPSFAADYPTRPLRLIVGFPAGGPTDIVARIMAQSLSERVGQQVIDRGEPAGRRQQCGDAGGDRIAAGYTLMIVSPPHAINATLYKKLPYNFLAARRRR